MNDGREQGHQPTRRPLLIGLSGPIGCGKSTVAQMLQDAGGRAVDADQLAREVTAPGTEALTDIRRRFGDGVFDGGELDRTALAAVVFADAPALRDLESIVHPRVRAGLEAVLAGAQTEDVPFIALEAIKLVEGGLAEWCDEVWIIDCPPEVQRARLAQRGVPAADVARRVAAQGDGLSQRLVKALAGGVPTRVISTAGTLESTRRKTADALQEALARFAAR